MSEGSQVSAEVGKGIDSAIETLRWCREHLQERGVTLRLRELAQTLAGVTLALDYEMDGQRDKAELALGHSDWRVHPKHQPFSNPTFDVHW